MFLRFSQILLIYFLLFSYVESAESGGMPQLNPEFWFSQIFWLIIAFGIMFILLSKLVLPKISENLEIRKAQILENIDAAEKQREESDKKLKEYEKLILESKIEAKNYFNKAREKILKDVNKKKENILEAPLKELMGKLIILTSGKIGETKMIDVTHLRIGDRVRKLTYKELQVEDQREVMNFNKRHL